MYLFFREVMDLCWCTSELMLLMMMIVCFSINLHSDVTAAYLYTLRSDQIYFHKVSVHPPIFTNSL